jgi:AcrR family transcriptional regulator
LQFYRNKVKQTFDSIKRLDEEFPDMATIETRDRILDAAEHLFAEQGFAGTSLRSITTAAEANLAAVNYHYGSKEALLIAVFERRINPINEARIEGLDRLEAEAGSGPMELEALLRIFLGPALRIREAWGDDGDRFMQFAGRAHSDPDIHVRTAFQNLFKSIIERFMPAFSRALPEMSQDELHMNLHFVIGAMAHTMAWSRKNTHGFKCSLPDMNVELLLDRMVSFSAAGFRSLKPDKPAGENA